MITAPRFGAKILLTRVTITWPGDLKEPVLQHYPMIASDFLTPETIRNSDSLHVEVLPSYTDITGKTLAPITVVAAYVNTTTGLPEIQWWTIGSGDEVCIGLHPEVLLNEPQTKLTGSYQENSLELKYDGTTVCPGSNGGVITGVGPIQFGSAIRITFSTVVTSIQYYDRMSRAQIISSSGLDYIRILDEAEAPLSLGISGVPGRFC